MPGTTHAVWTRKDLVGIADLTRGEIEMVLDAAPQFGAVSQRASGIKKVPLLHGRLVVLWFHEPSTRTRSSFELAAKRLSADTLAVASSTSSSVKGETLHDTLANIEAMRADITVIRHSCAGAPHLLAGSHRLILAVTLKTPKRKILSVLKKTAMLKSILPILKNSLI